ncbi:MAG TPA: kelch repeat-containing protein [Labilithrix sp.]|nr:kelch repeat-containing protein [Labilithrix sp.]
MAVRFTLRGAAPVVAATADGLVLYRDVLPEADLLYRIDAAGIEDFVVFDKRPAVEELVYDVDVSRVASVRLERNSLAFLDRQGTPRLRVASPWVMDALGDRREAKLSIEGCAYDDVSLGPPTKGRRPPGAGTCALHVAWTSGTYPALVDPSWSGGQGAFRERGGATLTVLPDGRAIAIGGFSQPEVYDPATNVFTFTGGCGGARAYDTRHTATTLASGRVLIAGGNPGFDPVVADAFLENGLTSTCDTAGPMAVARSNHTATRLPNGKVLVTGGQTTIDVATALATAEIFDEATGKFSLAAAMSVARTNHSATLLPTGKVLIVNGTAGTSAELFEPATGVFTATGPATAVRLGRPTATLLRTGKVLVTGGRSDATTKVATAELYDPATGTFAATGSMLTARDAHMAVLLPNDKVLVFGGDTNAAELYNPKTGTFTATVPSIGVYPIGASTLLNNGKVLVIPDYGAHELYDPAKPLGATCSTGADCDSDICSDGVCCDAPCAGQCQACNVTGKVGLCTTVTGAPHAPRKPCAGAGGLCGGACRGTNANACSFADTQTICGSSCSKNSQTTSSCNGLGDCVAGSAVSCNNLLCADERSCKPSCVSSADCVAGFLCESGKCINSTTCADEHTAQPLVGPPQDCGAYKCVLGCKTLCVSVDDCVAPNACNARGECVAPAEESDSGCSASGDTGANPAWSLLGLVALVAHRKRRRQVR